ncbi:alpha/beta fold hydrolase [Castellaniella defragrans]|jgi:pimeloyl-ACP methyl ester carboxylesterase|uniref:Pimeloyl-ACP methyl ester carboxylesterase n=2 Tax=Castellaniella defragrans TaxID=75697 RepID=A0A7W9TNV1_CASDE|nr:alpha/beta fold hydrolase [Castellaniella defragrans]KAB0619951.1 alpha/beta fold hydrolase [Castellaniella defragrans]MBB6084188.1 pimeloyl-ACP methyl ester carboxylesterase [Castellaniella defragrans]CDM22738.1 putative 3-oxoadipate enol-lactone hydrolase / 4-carboxymuconolactone decarboxylase [Castellaniella defragrans 65Phen]
MPVVEVLDTHVSYAVDGQGPALVLVAGTGGTLDSNWGHLVAPLAARRTVIRPDYSGSGETTDPAGELSLDLLAAQVLGAADAAGAESFDLAGFSLGACVAAQIAATQPGRVRSLTLLAGFSTGQDPRMRMQSELWLNLIRHDPHDFARLILLTGFSPAFLGRMDAAQLAQWADAVVVSNRWEGITRQIMLDTRLDIRPLLPRIAAPTLVIGCAHDAMVPKEHARALADAIPGARYAELDSGHLAPFEQPEAFLNLLAAFIDAPRG